MDLRDDSLLKNLPAEADVVIHLAANARVYELVEHPNRARDNFITLFNTLEYARRNKIQKFIFASSREGYGNVPEEVLREDMVRVENCESPYTASKVGGEALVHAYASCYRIAPVILRFSNVYGMYDNSVRVVPQFIRSARAGEPLAVYGEEKCLDFTYIDDAVAGILLVLEKYKVAAAAETFNIAYGEGAKLVDLASLIIQLTKSSSRISIKKSRTGEIIRYVADISKAKTLLGFAPKTPFTEGVAKAVAWYGQHQK